MCPDDWRMGASANLVTANFDERRCMVWCMFSLPFERSEDFQPLSGFTPKPFRAPKPRSQTLRVPVERRFSTHANGGMSTPCPSRRSRAPSPNRGVG